jgi:hypothetical protein
VSREEIDCFLYRFRNTDTSDEQARQRLIDCFVNAVYIFDDKIVLVFNYKDGTKTVSLADVNGSDLKESSPPSKKPLLPAGAREVSLRADGLNDSRFCAIPNREREIDRLGFIRGNQKWILMKNGFARIFRRNLKINR